MGVECKNLRKIFFHRNYRSNIFLRSTPSSWSRNVYVDRLVHEEYKQHARTVRHILFFPHFIYHLIRPYVYRPFADKQTPSGLMSTLFGLLKMQQTAYIRRFRFVAENRKIFQIFRYQSILKSTNSDMT